MRLTSAKLTEHAMMYSPLVICLYEESRDFKQPRFFALFEHFWRDATGMNDPTNPTENFKVIIILS